jgi:hypothetical protein
MDNRPRPDIGGLKVELPPVLLTISALLWKLVAVASNVDFLMSPRSATFALLFGFFLATGWAVLLVVGICWLLANLFTPVRGKAVGPATIVVVGIVAFSWGVLLAVQSTGAVPHLVTKWGRTSSTCDITVDTTHLAGFKDSYDLAFVCGIVDPAQDKYADTRIAVSSTYSIHPPGRVDMLATYSVPLTAEIEELKKKATEGRPEGSVTYVPASMWYEAIIVPKGMDMSALHRLSDVTIYGGNILDRNYFE